MQTSAVRLFFRSTLFLLLFSSAAFAGPITGQVVDPDRRGVGGADVLLTFGTSVVARTVTDQTGRFSLSAPDSGDLVVRIAIAGFRADPLPLALTPAARDVGTIALAISAVPESVVVSAAQVEVPLSTTASSVTIVTGEELQRRQVESLADALRFVPGLSVAANGGRGATTSVFPRGGESDYSLVLVDGVQANTFGGGFDFAHLPAANIDRVEIIRGPQSALYGSNAIGSVVRIITRRGGPPQASASIEGGSLDTTRATGATSGSSGSWEWGGTFERLATDGRNGTLSTAGETIVNDDYERHSFSGAGGWRPEGTAFVRGDLRYARDERGFPGPYGSNPGGTFEGIDAVSRGTFDRWLMSGGAGFALRRMRTTVEATHARIDGAFASSFGDSESWSRRTTGRAQGNLGPWKELESSFGLEYQWERAGGTFITASGGSEVPVERSLTGVFAEGRWNRAARLFVTAGLRTERIARRALAADDNAFAPRPRFDDDTIVSTNPKLSAAWYVHSNGGSFTKVRGSAGTGIRPPDAFEIAFTNNPSLKPERSRSAEAGVDQGLFDGLALVEATTFFNRYDDLIVAVGSFEESSRYRTANISNARARGLELAATLRARLRGIAAGSVQARFGYTLLDTEILAVDLSGDAPPPFTPGDELLRRPKHQFSADVVLDAGRLTAFVQGGGRSRVLDVDPSFGTFGGLFDAPGYGVWNSGAAWRLHPRVELFGRVTNLFDRDYEEALGFPAPGRSALAGVRVATGR